MIDFNELIRLFEKMQLDRAGRLGDGTIRVHLSILMEESDYEKFKKLFPEYVEF
jgi:hypothetical protein